MKIYTKIYKRATIIQNLRSTSNHLCKLDQYTILFQDKISQLFQTICMLHLTNKLAFNYGLTYSLTSLKHLTLDSQKSMPPIVMLKQIKYLI